MKHFFAGGRGIYCTYFPNKLYQEGGHIQKAFIRIAKEVLFSIKNPFKC